MNMKRLLWGFILIAATALLAGCGGGGGGTSLMVGDQRATQDLIDALVGERDTAQGERDAAQGERDTAQGERDAANMTLAAVRAALGLMADADQAAIEAKIMEVQDANPEDPIIARLRTALDLAPDATPAMILAEVETLRPAGVAPNDMSNGILGAIVAPSTAGVPSTARGTELTTRPGKGDDATDEQVFVRQGDGTTATPTTAGIFVGPVAGDDPTADEYTAADQLRHDDMEDGASVMGQFSDGPATSLSKMFTSTTHERTMTDDGTTTTDTINLVTNLEAPGAMSFADYYSTIGRPGVSGLANTVDPTSADDPGLGQITIQTAAGDANLNLGLLSSSAFPSGDSQTFTYVDAAPDASPPVAEMRGGRTLMGSFNGVPGSFNCTGNECSATTDSDGDLSALAGTWTFTPTSTMTSVPGVDHDSDYLAFGWWLQTTTDADGDTTYGVGTFAEGAQVFALATAQAREGSATYSGPAAGKYGRKTFNADGGVATLAVGHFTADANLKAYFGGNDVAANKHDTISGSVTDFRDADNNVIDAGWTVELMKAGFGAEGDTNEVDATFPAGYFGGEATGVNGGWRARFFGPATGPDGPDDNTGPVLPSGVAGEFTGHFANGHVIGAFGATRD